MSIKEFVIQSVDARKHTVAAGWILVAVCMSHNFAFAQDTPDYFRLNCKSCHTIGGGRLAGPDLKDVEQRAPSREWLLNFLQDPKGTIGGDDAYAQKIYREARQVPMPLAPGMNRERAEKLIDLIAAESKLPESEFKGMQISNDPFTPADVALGRAIFMGSQRLEERGSACISCHSMYDATALGGGRLGPDLTNVYDRLKGRVALANWLSAPGTETMQPIFRNHPMKEKEIYGLVAYFESAAKHRASDPTGGRVMFLLLGLGVATGLMFAFDTVWKWRLRGVRRPLVEAGKTRGASS